MNARILASALVGAAVLATGAFAADASPKMNKEQLKSIQSECHKEHGKDKTAYRACVKEKQKDAAAASSTAPAAGEAPATGTAQ